MSTWNLKVLRAAIKYQDLTSISSSQMLQRLFLFVNNMSTLYGNLAFVMQHLLNQFPNLTCAHFYGDCNFFQPHRFMNCNVTTGQWSSRSFPIGTTKCVYCEICNLK